MSFAFRSIYVVDHTPKVVYSRKYPSVEFRCRTRDVEAYRPAPDAAAVESCLKSLMDNGDPWRIACVSVNSNALLILRDQFYSIVGCPETLDEADTSSTPSTTFLSKLPSAALMLVLDVISRHSALQVPGLEQDRLFALNAFFGVALPFGTLTYDSELAAAEAATDMSLLSKTDPIKQPAWKPALSSGQKPALSFTIREIVRYSNRRQPAAMEVYGSVLCDAVVDGVPDISLSVQETACLSSLSCHPCVQSFDVRPNSVSVYFSPASGRFPLCRYSLKENETTSYVRQCLNMKFRIVPSSTDTVELEFSARFTAPPRFAQAFVESLEATFCFPSNVEVTSLRSSDCKIGKLSVNNGCLSWTAGPRTSIKKADFSLSASVLVKRTAVSTATDQIDWYSPEVVEAESHARVSFRISECLCSNASLSSLSVYPPTNLEPKMLNEICSAEYYVYMEK